MKITGEAFRTDDFDLAKKVEPLCQWIGILCDELKTHNYNTHEYLKHVRERKDFTYRIIMEEYEAKYNINKF